MRHRIPLLITACLIALLAPAVLAAETATARFNAYLGALASAQKLSDVRPYFTSKAWNQSYGQVTSTKAADQKAVITAVAADFKGWKVKSETVKEGKTVLLIGLPNTQKEDTEVLMIRQNGVWLIDG